MKDEITQNRFREIVIPGDVLDDERLSDGAKIMYGKIARLSFKTGYCWAGNKFLDGTKSGQTASRQIKELVNAGYLESRTDSGGTRNLFICEISSVLNNTSSREEDPLIKNDKPP